MPHHVAQEVARAMGESLYLPAAVLVVGVIAALLFTNPHSFAQDRKGGASTAESAPTDA